MTPTVRDDFALAALLSFDLWETQLSLLYACF